MSEPRDAAPAEAGPPSPGPSERPDHLILYTDGGASGNPGPAGAAALVKDDQGVTLLERVRAFGPATNNVAEYQAVILGLELAATLRPRRLTIRSDSELLVRQLVGQYAVKSSHLKPLHRQVKALLEPFEAVEIEHIPRRENAEADKLAKKAVERAKAMREDLPPDARRAGPGKVFRLK